MYIQYTAFHCFFYLFVYCDSAKTSDQEATDSAAEREYFPWTEEQAQVAAAS